MNITVKIHTPDNPKGMSIRVSSNNETFDKYGYIQNTERIDDVIMLFKNTVSSLEKIKKIEGGDA